MHLFKQSMTASDQPRSHPRRQRDRRGTEVLPHQRGVGGRQCGSGGGEQGRVQRAEAQPCSGDQQERGTEGASQREQRHPRAY